MNDDQLRQQPPLRTVIIGSGNVASVVVPQLEASGAIDVVAVYSPTPGHADRLARQLKNARGVSRPEDVPTDAGLYLVAIKDDAIATLAKDFDRNGGIWLHTSGGVDASALSPLTDDYGVFYPLQTYSRGVEVNLAEVPVFIEGNSQRALQTARRLGDAVSPKVYEVTSNQRARLHAAAVFACNFTNHMWAIADDILRRETGTDLSVLAPLVRETMRKALLIRPAEGQTGPARRHDLQVIDHHCALLRPDEAKIYRFLSDEIMKYHELN